MRLHLDPANTPGTAETTGAKPPLQARGTSGLGGSAVSGPDSGLGDSVAVSSALRAWTTSFGDRAERIGALAAAVQHGSYRIPSAALSQSIIDSAIS